MLLLLPISNYQLLDEVDDLVTVAVYHVLEEVLPVASLC
jgi:hypothetical protein